MGYRIEKDFLGEKQVPDDAYYGVQTLRGKENFHITGMPMSREPYFVKAFGYVKKAAAMANRDLGVLDRKIADAIIRACDRVIAGDMNDHFVTDFIQGGAGTSTNMNANEVIANLALESLGHKKGEYQYVNPNDHVNFGQSTNDVYPTAFHLGLILRLESYMEALRQLQAAFFAKAREFYRVLKMGRTHLQDAVPMSLGAEFQGWGTTIGEEVNHLAEVGHILHGINLGATAIGTTVTAAPGYPALATKHLADITGIKFTLAEDLIEATSDTGDYVLLSGVLKHTSVKLTKICNDLRMLASAALRVQRDQPAADAAGLVDHAGQGESRDPGSREPDQLPRDRPRPHGHPRGLRRAAAAERHGAGDHLRALRLDRHHGARGHQPSGELRGGHHRQRRAHPGDGAQFARHRDGAQALARLQAVRRDRPRGSRDGQEPARHRR
jgi:hypothetical protein